MRCKDLLSDPTLDLVISNFGPTGYEATDLSVLNPKYRYLNVPPYQALTQTTASLSPLNYQVVDVTDATSLKSVSDPTKDIEYDYSVCKRPQTFGLDPKVKKGLLCLEINTNNTIHTMNT